MLADNRSHLVESDHSGLWLRNVAECSPPLAAGQQQQAENDHARDRNRYPSPPRDDRVGEGGDVTVTRKRTGRVGASG